MRSLRAACAASGVLLACTAGALHAQEAWNDPRSLELVRAATARRALQLADTGLRDYTARATGTLTFLAQLGDGILSRPVVVRADQLELEVYWGAPNRSKQRIIGRRDTLLLPNDQQYHRDHLGIIQNNFPDVIRLGDGDEVLDVVHPLSPRGPATYDYRIADSLAIRGSGLSVDVVMVSVRPKDPRAPAAVGAVYVDRATAAVVRMTFSFTRAALRDPRLDDVSVILENGLVEGRYWLPRRQEIEVRRSASWMDFPATGIIRGRWEICCVQANLGLGPPVFAGREIVEAGPPEQLRNFPFEREVLDALPEDVRALDAEEVRAVQEEARRLVREGALARASGGSLHARAVSDFVRSNRVEGVALGAGLSRRLGGGFSASIAGRYGFADESWKGRGTLSWRRADGWGVVLEGDDDIRLLGEVPEVSLARNSIASQEFGSDWTQPLRARGGALRVEWAPPERGRVFLEAARRAESVPMGYAPPARGQHEIQFIPTPVRRTIWTLGAERSGVRAEGAAEWRASARVSRSRWRDAGSPITEAMTRASVDLEWQGALPAGRLRVRTIAAHLWSNWSPVEQDFVRFGGPQSGPGYDFHSLSAWAGVSQRLEWQHRVPFLPVDLGRFGRVPGSLVVAPYVHGVWLHRAFGLPVAGPGPPQPDREGWNPSVGIAAIGLFDLLRLDVARGLRDGRWMFSLDVTRALWPVL